MAITDFVYKNLINAKSEIFKFLQKNPLISLPYIRTTVIRSDLNLSNIK